jgi:hypothetical protein
MVTLPKFDRPKDGSDEEPNARVDDRPVELLPRDVVPRSAVPELRLVPAELPPPVEDDDGEEDEGDHLGDDSDQGDDGPRRG